ncbi:hypothetical protein H9P43_008428 [Blastocladiella emersonii ATCC 22665]|nr:hypothetical protein H9P43_008428 [Blastocladiella emersonii ATCC 22665]
MTGPSAILLVNRLLGLMTSGPSVMTTVNVINCVAQRYKARALQKAIIASSLVSLLVDLLVVFSVTTWVIDPAWSFMVPMIVAITALKRLHSVVPVHLSFLRMTAVIPTLNVWKNWANLYTAGYVVLGASSVACQVYAYSTNGWDSARARSSAAFSLGYRGFNVASIVYYAAVAIGSDIYFLSLSRKSPILAQRFSQIRQFYNIWIYCVMELLVAAVVVVPLILSVSGSGYDWVSSTYTEQFLLALITLNASLSIKAVSLMVDDSSSGNLTTGHGGGQTTTANPSTVRGQLQSVIPQSQSQSRRLSITIPSKPAAASVPSPATTTPTSGHPLMGGGRGGESLPMSPITPNTPVPLYSPASARSPAPAYEWSRMSFSAGSNVGSQVSSAPPPRTPRSQQQHW